MATLKQRKICKSCGTKSIVTKLHYFEGNFYHSTCLGSNFQKCPISGEFLTPEKSQFYNDIKLIAPMTFQLWVESRKADQ